MDRPNLIERLLNLLRRRSEPPPGGNGVITCHEALERLFEFLDGELESTEAKKFEEHLRICELCYPHLLFEQSFREAVRRALEGQRAPAAVRARVLEVLESEEGHTHT